MFQRKETARQLGEQLTAALERGKLNSALEIYEKLEALEPGESRWPHRKGDLLLRMSRRDEAVEAFAVAIRLYATQGFVARAAALAKLVLDIDRTRTDILAEVDPEAARRLHRKERTSLISAAEDIEPARPSLISDAPPLQTAHDAKQDEIRFEDSRTFEIEVSEISVRPPPIPEDARRTSDRRSSMPVVEIEPEGRRTAEQLARLPSMPLFCEVPRSALDSLLLNSSLIDLSDGELLIKSGDPSDTLYIIVEGALQVHFQGRVSGEPILLGEGDVVGESCILDHANRRADVVAIVFARMLAIPKPVLDDLVKTHPRFGDVLFELLSRRLISNLVKTNPMFTSFNAETRAELTRAFEVRRAAAGTVLMKAGLRADGLYLPLAGRIEIERSGNAPVQLGRERVFGQHSLISSKPSGVTVRMVNDGLVLRLPANRFIRIAMQFPAVLEHLANLGDATFELP